jgi:hypothetical protein
VAAAAVVLAAVAVLAQAPDVNPDGYFPGGGVIRDCPGWLEGLVVELVFFLVFFCDVLLD